MSDAYRILEIIREIELLSRRSQLVIADLLCDAIYPEPAPEYDADIVYECKEKFRQWINQQIEVSNDETPE